MEHYPWVTSYGINYDLGVDGLSMPMVLIDSNNTF